MTMCYESLALIPAGDVETPPPTPLHPTLFLLLILFSFHMAFSFLFFLFVHVMSVLLNWSLFKFYP